VQYTVAVGNGTPRQVAWQAYQYADDAANPATTKTFTVSASASGDVATSQVTYPFVVFNPDGGVGATLLPSVDELRAVALSRQADAAYAIATTFGGGTRNGFGATGFPSAGSGFRIHRWNLADGGAYSIADFDWSGQPNGRWINTAGAPGAAQAVRRVWACPSAGDRLAVEGELAVVVLDVDAVQSPTGIGMGNVGSLATQPPRVVALEGVGAQMIGVRADGRLVVIADDGTSDPTRGSVVIPTKLSVIAHDPDGVAAPELVKELDVAGFAVAGVLVGGSGDDPGHLVAVLYTTTATQLVQGQSQPPGKLVLRVTSLGDGTSTEIDVASVPIVAFTAGSSMSFASELSSSLALVVDGDRVAYLATSSTAASSLGISWLLAPPTGSPSQPQFSNLWSIPLDTNPLTPSKCVELDRFGGSTSVRLSPNGRDMIAPVDGHLWIGPLGDPTSGCDLDGQLGQAGVVDVDFTTAGDRFVVLTRSGMLQLVQSVGLTTFRRNELPPA